MPALNRTQISRENIYDPRQAPSIPALNALKISSFRCPLVTPGMMRCLRLLSLSATAIALAEIATPLESAWHDTHVKHTWNAVPDRWESLGCPPSSTAIDLYLVLKPYHENALIDVLHGVSNPRHSKYILSSTHICGCPLPDMVHTYQRNRFLSFPRNPQARHRLT